MKKILLLTFTVMLMSLMSCGQNGGVAVGSKNTKSPFPTVKANCGDSSCM